ncbi:hypothetical protein [Desulfolutivibrio sulfoxidireducens]|uniref:hypothetical protein n=1 Tax=Desulfolutivibrio sulfoxidireducens TaxID=2773299 RepID=UPI001FEA81BA|nr:hypothetical protein [Desulfolutivibrio sulfoxidireducens]QLA16937.1 hypothetical protein GD605_12975 [Desulfolutivibrio sulfoxidireducens]QLA20503.1 hypothetical protein GD604_12690 [Desulfolutivibrio sulfoxidireducens]
MLDPSYLEKIEAYIRSGDLEFDFDNGDDDRKGAILDYLERLMDLAELADETATKLIFKGSLGAMVGIKSEK